MAGKGDTPGLCPLFLPLRVSLPFLDPFSDLFSAVDTLPDGAAPERKGMRRDGLADLQVVHHAELNRIEAQFPGNLVQSSFLSQR